MQMHPIGRLGLGLDPAGGEPAALVFRAALGGSASVQWRHRRVRLDEDCWLVLDGREDCAWQADAESGVDAVEIRVSSDIVQAGLDLAAQTQAPKRLAFADHLRSTSGPAGRRLLDIARARKLDRFAQPHRDALIELVCAAVADERELRGRAARIRCVKAETRDALLRRILLAADFIASHHDEPISLDQIARASSLSRFHFVRIFSVVHGETPHAFLLRKRIAVARRHLAVGDGCCEAATRAGFGSRSALFRNLRKVSAAARSTVGSALVSVAEPCFPSA
jgi:AraC-like DNA-binding protein